MIKILIADDHAIFREGLKEIFEGVPDINDVEEAKNGREVMKAVRSKDFNLVLLDITMPGKSGIEILKEIKIEKPDLPVLMLSMHSEEEYALRAFRAGASGYLTKESDSEEVIKAIRKVSSGENYVSSEIAQKLAFTLKTGGNAEPHARLSDREYEVMCLLASGKKISQIADELSLGVRTVSTYKYRIFEKMNIKSIAEIVRYALEKQLIK